MKTSHRWLGVALLLLTAAAPPARVGGPVVLSSQPGTPLDQTARELVSQDLLEAGSTGEAPLLLIGTALLGTATDRAVLFVQLQSPRECGSSGCSTSAFAWLKTSRQWTKVLDSVGGSITVATTRQRGMLDLVAGQERYGWTGSAYVNTRPAPAVDLRPRAPR
ncbi:MAG: hypothetical protein H7Z10_12765 [Gemmatimonadaceae bacterium]|nr:hypothetical protein [Acetobacteraceae bacterium]